MDGRWRRWAAPVVALPLLLATGCGLFGQAAPELDLVAGGGDTPDATTAERIRLDGYAIDLAAGSGRVHLLAQMDGDRYLASVAPDGTVSTIDLSGFTSGPSYLAAGPAGEAYLATGEVIYRVERAELAPVVVRGDVDAPDGIDEPAPDLPRASGGFQGIAVDGDGRLVWTESFFDSEPEGAQPDDAQPDDSEPEHGGPLIRVMRLDAGEVAQVADASEVPQDVGYAGSVAADDDGTIYLGGTTYLRRVTPDGQVEPVIARGERAEPEHPFDDAGPAGEFGGVWDGTDLDASGGVLVATDTGLRHNPIDVDQFEWAGDFPDRARTVADTIVRRPRADGSFNLDRGSTAYGTVAVVVRDGEAATALAHVSGVAVADGVLYAVGQTRNPPTSHDHDAEMLVVSMQLPDDWR